MKFPLLQLPEVSLLNVLMQMDVLDKIRLNMVFDAVMRNKTGTYISLGNIEISIDECVSTLKVGNFSWCFKRKREWTEDDKSVVQTHFPMQYVAYGNMYKAHPLNWLSCVENTGKAVLRVYKWLMEAFPKSKLKYISVESPRNSVIEELMTMNCQKFERGTIEVPFERNIENTKFFKTALRGRDFVLTYVSEEEEPTVRAYFGKMRNDRTVPFLVPILSRCEYILLPAMEYTETHLHHIITFWMSGHMEKLVYVGVSGIWGLKITNFVTKTRVEDWSDDISPIPQFAEFFRKGIVITNVNGVKASIHINDERETFDIVVWRAHSQNTLQLYSQLPLY
ncbi:hypothetical protein CAEBREN_20657 [Caenorhabditis brenneri]|uniref:F-box domain-containing protein n=1 Tax=Caenorhabditis brenneri TaxID=135651 RepID=G0MX30_CAEBE|nr:hypothetical protein CAEBREN_20657 [Caenorhabditis brenneri]